jgi:hypothetical protein
MGGYHAAVNGIEFSSGVRLFHLVPLITGLSNCASVPGPRMQEGTDYGRDSRGVWVRGPWESIKPSTDIDEVIDQLCPAVMQLPDARGHDDGTEYCGLLYQGTDRKFHASAPSRLSLRAGARPSLDDKKTCILPTRVDDPAGLRTVEADFHNHPWPGSPLTPLFDTGARSQKYSIRVQFDTTCHVLKFVPHVNEPVPAEVFERVGRSWRILRVIPVYDKEKGVIDPPFEVP